MLNETNDDQQIRTSVLSWLDRCDPDKPFKYPRYAVFGNGLDTWEVDILYGHGHVENVEVFTVEEIQELYQQKHKYVEPAYAYLIARDKAMEHKEELERTKPLA
jgi:hypothetical protein